MFDTVLFGGDYDMLVYSVLMNYTQDVLRHKNGRWPLAYGGYTGSEKTWYNSLHLSDEETDSIKNEYDYIGQQNVKDFLDDLEWLVKSVKNKKIIFINGSEITDFNEQEVGACERHKMFNSALEEFVSHHPNCQILDVRKLISSRSDCKDNLRHYQRPVYVKMAEQLMTMLNGEKIRVPLRLKIKDIVLRIYWNIRK